MIVSRRLRLITQACWSLSFHNFAPAPVACHADRKRPHQPPSGNVEHQNQGGERWL